MNKKKLINDLLDSYFPDPICPLDFKDPFTLLIAVLLSAQATDAKVNTITPLLFAKADTPEKMAALSLEEIQEIIRPCGLSKKKAHYIKTLSQVLIKKYKSKTPKRLTTLEKLPGVGRKTASVVVGTAFATPAFPVDRHILRLAKRWHLTESSSPLQVEKDLKKWFKKSQWLKRHLQMILFGRTYCKALNHQKRNCPICKLFA